MDWLFTAWLVNFILLITLAAKTDNEELIDRVHIVIYAIVAGISLSLALQHMQQGM